MKAFVSLILRLLGKRRRHRSVGHRVAIKILVPVAAVVIGATAAFFAFDEFTYYMWFLLQKEGGTTSQYMADTPGLDDYFADSFNEYPVKKPQSGNPTTGKPTGEQGLTGMYINKMGASYYAEMLTIFREHCNWNQMNPLCTDNVWTFDDGTTVNRYPIMASVIGALIAESGTSDGVAPRTLLPQDSWDGTTAKTLSLFNTKYYTDNPGFALADGIGSDLIYGDSSYLTHWQFSENYFGVMPGKDDLSASWFNFYPSLMNGYGVEDGTIREQRKGDAMYFPDQVATYIQATFGEASYWCDVDTLTEMGAMAASYPIWNGSSTIVYITWGTGANPNAGNNDKFSTSKGTWHEKNGTTSKSVCASEAANLVGESISICFEYAINHQEELSWFNHPDYSGMAAMALLQEGGFLASENAKNQLISDMAGNSFARGALLAYKAYTGDVDATVETVREYFSGLEVQPIDEDFYGPTYGGKSGKWSEVIVHMYSDTYEVYNNQGEGPRPLLHCFNEESVRGSYMSYMAGIYSYWQMLLNIGVECTLRQAASDSTGSLVPDMLSSGSYYFGTREFGSVIYGSTTHAPINSPIYWRFYVNPDGTRSEGMHVGEDFITSLGNDLYGKDLAAIADAQVTFVGKVSGYGRTMKFRVKDSGAEGEKPLYFWYAHMYSYASGLEAGVSVQEGELVGTSGSSGTDKTTGALKDRAYGVHLHLTFLVEDAAEGQKTTTYVLPFHAIAEGTFSPYNAPRMVHCAKGAAAGTVIVYDKNMKALGCVIQKQKELYPNKPGSGWWNDADAGYYAVGPMMFIDEVRRAP